MQRSKVRKLRRPEGQCYYVSGKVVLDEREGVLVHGSVWSHFLQKRIGHAWVELPIGTTVEDGSGDVEVLKVTAVLDLTLKKRLRLLPKDVYFAIAKAEEEARFTADQLCTMVLRHKTWGPWESQARLDERLGV